MGLNAMYLHWTLLGTTRFACFHAGQKRAVLTGPLFMLCIYTGFTRVLCGILLYRFHNYLALTQLQLLSDDSFITKTELIYTRYKKENNT